jgi:uncharacterized protein YfcZ (UPF0381/DUF406 family)
MGGMISTCNNKKQNGCMAMEEGGLTCNNETEGVVSTMYRNSDELTATIAMIEPRAHYDSIKGTLSLICSIKQYM